MKAPLLASLLFSISAFAAEPKLADCSKTVQDQHKDLIQTITVRNGEMMASIVKAGIQAKAEKNNPEYFCTNIEFFTSIAKDQI